MIEIDLLRLGHETTTGDAVACRFTIPQDGCSAAALAVGDFAETDGRIWLGETD